MKKRCTNSKCRKYFNTDINKATCPHCGKHYPRLPQGSPVFVVTDLGENPEMTSLRIHRMIKGTGSPKQTYELVRRRMPRFTYDITSEERAKLWCLVVTRSGGKAHIEWRNR